MAEDHTEAVTLLNFVQGMSQNLMRWQAECRVLEDNSINLHKRNKHSERNEPKMRR